MLEHEDIPDSKCREIFHITFNETAKVDQKDNWLDQMRTYSGVQNKLKMTEHLFGEDIACEVAVLLASLLLLLRAEENHGDPKKWQRAYVEQSKKVEEKCEPKIKELLALKNCE